jgi:hypothetical protein
MGPFFEPVGYLLAMRLRIGKSFVSRLRLALSRLMGLSRSTFSSASAVFRSGGDLPRMASMECGTTPAAMPERNVRRQPKDTNMTAQQNRFSAIEGANASGRQVHGARSNQWYVAFLVGLCAILLAASAGFTTLVGSPQVADAAMAAAMQPTPQVEYFPSQYVNQATENSEHIQAF